MRRPLGTGFLDWWLGGLMLWLKPAARARLMPPSSRVWLRANDATLNSASDDPRWLLLDDSDVIRATLQMPLAAIDQLRQAVRYEIDRQTPYAESDVAYDVRVVERDVAGKRITAELLAVPKTRLEPLVERIEHALGAPLHGIDVADGAGRPLGVNLLPDPPPPSRPWRWINLGLIALIAIALSLLLWRSVANARARADGLEAALKQQSDHARAVTLQRQRLDDLVAGAKKVQDEQARHGDLAAIINALAERLPANVYVERMSLQNGQLQLSGQGASAAAVMSYLQANPLWETPSLSGASMNAATYGRERFTIAMRLKARGAK